MKKPTASKSRKSPKGKTSKVAPKSNQPKPVVVAARERDPRLPSVGTTITVERSGKTYSAVERKDGQFEHDGKPFGSLSAIARSILGCRANGMLFFHLTDAQTGRKATVTTKAAATTAPKARASKGSAGMKPVGAREKKVLTGAAAKVYDTASPEGQRQALIDAGIIKAGK